MNLDEIVVGIFAIIILIILMAIYFFYEIVVGIFIIIILIILMAIYFLPTSIASSKKHKNTGAIAVINLFLGWTFLGWVIALAIALSHDDTKQEHLEKDDNSNDDFEYTTERLENIKKLLDNDLITEEEYDKKRIDILQGL